MNKRIIIAGLLGALMAVGSAGYAGATCVNVKGKGGCFASINTAIGATPAGGTITIAAGRYYEAVVVNKIGLVLVGPTTGAAIVDPYETGLPGIDIIRKNVTIQSLWVENSQTYGIRVENFGVKLLGVTVLDTDSYGIYTDQANTEIRNSTVRGAESDCIEVEGANATVADNNIGLCVIDGVYADASGARINRNRIFVAGGGGVDVEANGATANANTAGPTYHQPVYIDGAAPIANGNTGFSTEYPGVDITCSASCSASTVSANNVFNMTDDDGYYIEGDASGLVANANKATDLSYHGFNINGDAPATFSNNQSIRAGGVAIRPGFGDDGSRHTFSGNSASGSSGPGLELADVANVTLQGNMFTGNAESGIVITETSSGVNLNGNVANNNNQDGIVISSGSQVGNLTNNTALSNRADFCRAGTITGVNSGNNFGNRNTARCIYP